MYTLCPECRTVFRVAAGQLRQAQGRVRCGVCSRAFDALVTLHDSPDEPLEVEAGEECHRAEAVAVPSAALPARQASSEPQMQKAAAQKSAAQKPTPPQPPMRRASWLWAAAALVLASGLGWQGLHYHRAALAAHPQAGPWVLWLYERLGSPVQPAWPLEAFELRATGNAQRADGGLIRISAELRNRSDRLLPLPLLRLTLLDGRSEPVGSRVFFAADYAAERARDMLPPNDTLQAVMTVRSPETGEVYGYRLELCRRAVGGALACDNT